MTTINDGPGSNSVTGTPFDDIINGDGGHDTIEGLGGGDRIDGGEGVDRATYASSPAGVSVFLLDGSARGGDAEGDRLSNIEDVTGSGFADTIWGDNGDNFIDGGGGSNILKGFGGDDTLRGGGYLEGGGGDDALRGGFEADELFGGDENDLLDGREGADTLSGGDGVDSVVYEASDQAVTLILGEGGSGTGGDAEGDRYFGIENVVGSSGGDTVIGDGLGNGMMGRDGADTLKGGGGSDDLRGGLGTDDLQGGGGDDFLEGGDGADRLDGGAGIDTATYLDSLEGISVTLADVGSGGDAEGDTFTGIENIDGSTYDDQIRGDGAANRLFGDMGDDTLKGLGGADRLLGDLGDDTLVGGEGDDRLEGMADADHLVGGNGDDTYIADSKDFINELTGSGVDTVFAASSLGLNSTAISGAVENLTLTGSGNFSATGNALGNLLIGNSGANSINGNSGADVMRGMGGDDFYVVDETGDRVDESVAGSGGGDRILSFISISLSGPQVLGTVEALDLSGDVNGTGSAGANRIRGGSGDNVIAGKGGVDTLTGGAGEDTFVFDTGLNATTNRDVIEDFSVTQDTIRLENAIFTGLGTGTLDTGAFHIGVAAHDASDRVIYDDDTGALSFDVDGTGAAAAIRFASLDAHLAMSNAEFLIV